MIWSPEPIETALQTVEGQRRMTAYLRRLELISEIAFLSSLAVMLSGWLVIAPEWQPLVRAIMPLGLSLTVMRRAWRFTFLMILLEIAAIPLFPGGSTWDVFFVLAAVPVTVATGWAYRTHKKAAWRWVGTVLAMGLSQYLIAQTYYPQPLHTLMIWSIRPMRLLAPWLGLNAWLGWIPQYWFLGFIADQVFWGTGIFLVLAFFAELAELPIAQVPFLDAGACRSGSYGLPPRIWRHSLSVKWWPTMFLSLSWKFLSLPWRLISFWGLMCYGELVSYPDYLNFTELAY